MARGLPGSLLAVAIPFVIAGCGDQPGASGSVETASPTVESGSTETVVFEVPGMH